MIVFIQIIIWAMIWKLVQIAGIEGNPSLLFLPIAASFYLVVIKNNTINKKNGD